MAVAAQRDPETTPPDGPPREPVDPITRGDPTAVPRPTPIDDPRPSRPSKTKLGSIDREVARLIEIVESRLH